MSSSPTKATENAPAAPAPPTKREGSSRFAGCPPLSVGVSGPFASAFLNCLVREVLFADLPVPVELHWSAYAPSLTLELASDEQNVEVLEDCRDWKVMQRVAYMKRVLASVAQACADKTQKVQRVVLYFPFTTTFEFQVTLTTDVARSDVVVNTSATEPGPVDATNVTLSCPGYPPQQGVNLRLALASLLGGVSSPESQKLSEFLTGPLRSTVVAAMEARRELTRTLRRPAPTPQQQEQRRQSQQLQRSNSGSQPYIIPADPTVENSSYVPAFLRSQWHPPVPEWRPHGPEWQPRPASWKPHEPEWNPKPDTWSPSQQQQWRPQSPTWKPRQPEWQPHVPDYRPRLEVWSNTYMLVQ